MATVTEILKREASNASDTKDIHFDQQSVQNATQNLPLESKK
ncbi:7230_t:CDS:1, partial [Acaulospora colombiana]